MLGLVASCGSSGSPSPSNPPTAPSKLVYPQASISAIDGSAIAADTPSVTGSVSSYSISPALPAGLTISSATGAISGTPSAVSPQTSYTVTASNAAGSTTASVSISVAAALTAPSKLVYPQTVISATVGTAIAADMPSVTGSVSSYSISPALPAGLTISSATGAISGTPSAVSPQTSYTVTASNAAGSTTASVSISVAAALTAPSKLDYPQAVISAAVGTAIATDTPTVTGTVSSFSISPTLPAGLTINSATGAISGTPSAVSPQTSYTVTASNAAGSTTASVSVAVAAALTAPSHLVYPQTVISAAVGTAIAADTPTVTGTVSSYSISPALPAGLTINSATGVISGTPTAASPQIGYKVTAANAAGSTTALVAISVTAALTAPSNLVYPQTVISAAVGAAITADTPSVTGTVSSFSISPALPAGLTINSATGTISGTPTAVNPQTSYTVTASNAAGSATASISIAVAAESAPSNLAYPQTSILGFVGSSIATDLPIVTGTVSSYSISPALPPGLRFDPVYGTIGETPTAVSPKTSYTVTASNSAGSTTTQISITITAGPTSMLEVGHAAGIDVVRFSGNRVLTSDLTGHWTLWDYTSGQIVADGDNVTVQDLDPESFAVAGNLAILQTATGEEVLSADTGQLLFTVPSSQWARLATDGSYVCTGSNTGLTVWSPAGLQEFSRTGNYTYAKAIAVPGQVQIARGNVIETDSVPNGSSSISAQFSGNFEGWFPDGQKFLTSSGGISVWVYTNDAQQLSFENLPALDHIVGAVGNWIWGVGSTSSGGAVLVYPIGSTTPAATYTGGSAVQSGSVLALPAPFQPQITLVDLSGASPSAATYTLPDAVGPTYSYPPYSTFAATSASQWVAGNQFGLVYDGASVGGTPRYFGYGEVTGIAASPNYIAIATANGEISIFDPTGATRLGTIPFLAGKLAMSSDGSMLAANAASNHAWVSNPLLNVYSLPSGAMLQSFPAPIDFSLSASGQTLGRVWSVGSSISDYRREVSGVSGSPLIWSDSGNGGSIVLSQNGTNFATNDKSPSGGTDGVLPIANLWHNGTLSGTIQSSADIWIDDTHLLAANYEWGTYWQGVYEFSSSIDDPSGNPITTFNGGRPDNDKLALTPHDQVYDPIGNGVYSLSSGAEVWLGPSKGTAGAVAGDNVVYVAGHQVYITPY